jgi:hypothetical protein
MISTDDLNRIKAYAATVDLFSSVLFPVPKHSNDGATQWAPGGSVVGGAEGTGDYRRQPEPCWYLRPGTHSYLEPLE